MYYLGNLPNSSIDTGELHYYSREKITSGVPQNTQGRQDNWPNKIFKSTRHLNTKMRSHTRARLETVIFVKTIQHTEHCCHTDPSFLERFFTDRWVSLGVGLNLCLRTHSLKGLVQIKERDRGKSNTTRKSFIGCFKSEPGCSSFQKSCWHC